MADLTTTLSVITPGGMVCGNARRVERQRLVIELVAELPVGWEADWRLELLGLRDTALGRLRVTEVLPPADGVRYYGAEILSVDERDRKLFDLWVAAVTAGRLVRVEAQDGEAEWTLFATPGSANARERKLLLAAMEDRKRHRQRALSGLESQKRKGWVSPDEDGDAEVISSVWRRELAVPPPSAPVPLRFVTHAEHPREEPAASTFSGVRRDDSSATTGWSTAPAIPPAPPASVARAPSPAATASPPPPAPSASSPPTPPPVHTDARAVRVIHVPEPMVSVSWANVGAFRRDWAEQLQYGAIVLPLGGAWRPGDVVSVQLLLPDGDSAEASAVVTYTSATSVCLRVDLDAAERARLSAT